MFAVLTAAALYVVLRPLMGGSAREESRAAFNATVYRDQLGEAETDRERGLIGGGYAEAPRVEIARRLLATDAKKPGAKLSPTPSPTKYLAVGLAVVLPLAAL